ncbi:DeoR/GlpR family DNA-binding transcription regulator [Woodsholea maritima]|uniref:DeoR/GlpR family DNA-binding transcription regulator n=1 Tax=Woodsholea maritima TaxID=240237 RepID=UPI0003664FBE|nr:DeoR/GlpR family DNA-binding transcription regulator [Woodsholea maritima]
MSHPIRQSAILTHLEEKRAASIAELAEQFNVSEETIRRDVRQLEAEGHVQKHHGGVRLPDNIFEAPYQLRMGEEGSAKRAIGAAAADLVEDGMTVLIDSGTTSCWVAKHLTRQRNLSIVTNAIEVAREVSGRNNNRVYLAGGEISTDYRSAFGPSAIDYARQFRPDLAFFSIGALDPDRGLLDFHMPEAEFKRAVMPMAQKSVIVADHTKFNRKGLIITAPFEVGDIYVFDSQPDAALQGQLRDKHVIIASPL